MFRLAWFESVLQDFRYGVRELLKHRGFAATAVLSLALGIMAATSMYSVIYGVIIDPFPYRDVGGLTSIIVQNVSERGGRGSYSVDEYAELARRADVFEGVTASTISDVLWTTAGEPRRLRGNHISNNGFDVMGVPAMLGRTVSNSEPDPETKAVLGYQFWVRQFGADPAVIGTTLILNNRPRTIVGIMPPRFMFRGADVYLPLRYHSGETPEGVSSVWVTARFKAGVNPAAATAVVDAVLRDLAKQFPTRFPTQWKTVLLSFAETFPSGIRKTLWIMFAAVGLLLLISCANVSNILLARASSRESEIAMRVALGAGRMRLFRQLLTESLVIGMAGAALGILLSWAGLRGILSVMPPDVIPSEAQVVLNVPVLLFSLGLCLVTTLIAGFAPALHASGHQLATTMKEAGRGSGGSRRMKLLRVGLVAGELSLAIVLLSGAGLFLHTFLTVKGAPLGVDIENRLIVRLPMRPDQFATTERRVAFLRDVLERVRATPGVLSTSVNSGIHPLGSMRTDASLAGAADTESRVVNFNQVDDDYLKTTGVRPAAGRWLENTDVSAHRHVAVVNREFVREFGLDRLGIGRVVRFPRLRTAPWNVSDDSFEIVGVTEDAIHELHNGEAQPEVYIPYTITGGAPILVVHTAGSPMTLAPVIRRQLAELNPTQAIDDPIALETLMEHDVYSGGRFRLWLMGVFGVLGLSLAVLGVYGLISQVVAVEQREFGIRLAVGAGFGQIVSLVLLRGLRMIGAGIAAGIVITWFLLRRFGIELGVTDPFHFASISGAALVLVAAALVACLAPALRAGRTDPVTVLRAE